MNSSYRPFASLNRTGRLLLVALFALLCSHGLHAADGPCLYIDDYDFGVLYPGQELTKSVELCNVGTGYISFTNPGGNDVVTWLEKNFTISDADMTRLKNTVLGPGKGTPDPNAPSCTTINLTFSARTSDYYKTTARFWADTRDCRDTSIWTAIVAQPGPQITGYDWQAQWVTTLNTCTKNTLSQYEAVSYISNDGTSSFKVQSLQISGPDAAYFSFDMSDQATADILNNIPGLEIKPGEANLRAQKILFTPDAERTYFATVCITTNSGESVCGILRGIGIESHIDITGKDFGTAEFKGTETTRIVGNVTLTIRQTRPTTITGMQFSGPDATDFRFNWVSGSGPFNYIPTPANPWVAAIGDVIDIPIEFAPATPGSKTAMIEVIGDFSECDTAIRPLTGNAVSSLSVSDNAADQILISTDRTGTFTLSLLHSAPVTLVLHDAAGNRVARLADDAMEPGIHRFSSSDYSLASGVYLYRLNVGGTVRTGSVVIVR